MRPVELVVAEAREHERRRVVDAPAEQPQQIECRVVGPVEVFQDEERRRIAPEL
jgi:hypothetical protein